MPPADNQKEEQTMEPIQVLVIDPEQTTRDQVRAALELDGRIELHLSSSAEGAKEVLIRKSRWALIVLNVWLPGQDAFSFVQEWKQHDPKTQFILLSQDASKSELVKALRLGVADYFEKPLAIADLKHSVETVVHRFKSVAPVISLPRSGATAQVIPAHQTELTDSLVPVAQHLRLVSSDASPEMAASTGDFDAPESQSYTHLKKKWIESFEVDYLSQLLNQHAGNVSAAAREARLDRSNFLRLLRKYGLKAEVFRSSVKMAA